MCIRDSLSPVLYRKIRRTDGILSFAFAFSFLAFTTCQISGSSSLYEFRARIWIIKAIWADDVKHASDTFEFSKFELVICVPLLGPFVGHVSTELCPIFCFFLSRVVGISFFLFVIFVEPVRWIRIRFFFIFILSCYVGYVFFCPIVGGKVGKSAGVPP